MKRLIVAGLFVVLQCAAIFAQKQSVMPKIVTNAQFVVVETEYGSIEDTIMASAVSAEDRAAVARLQEAIRSWGRYKLTLRRSDADLVFVVRKGRLASATGGVRIKTSSDRDGRNTGVGPLAGAEAGNPKDSLAVHSRNPDGSLSGPLWRDTLDKGLNSPQIVLFQRFKDEVERASADQKKP
jgi:hypothetical protein